MSSELMTLSVGDVLAVHDRLCEDFRATQDPIDPPGVRSMDLLESAVSRQETGFGDYTKYPDPVDNASTLLYGICNDHAFHNGNKRTALVAMLAHLDRNRLVLLKAKERELLRLMVEVADHRIVKDRHKVRREVALVPRRGTADEEVAGIADWLRPRVQRISRGEFQVTYRELRRLLQNQGYVLITSKNMKVSICRVEHKRNLLFREKQIMKPVMSTSWPGEGRTVALKQIKQIRRTLQLCEEDGVGSDVFYGQALRVDRFINNYRTVLRKLADK